MTPAIKAGIAPPESEELKLWAVKNDISPGISGPPLQGNELLRAVAKMKKEVLQLPTNQPGIIVIYSTSSILFFLYKPEDIMAVLAEVVQNYPSIYALVFKFSYLGPLHKTHEIYQTGESKLIGSTMAGLNTQIAVVNNPAFSMTLPPTTVDKIQKALTQLSSMQ